MPGCGDCIHDVADLFFDGGKPLFDDGDLFGSGSALGTGFFLPIFIDIFIGAWICEILAQSCDDTCFGLFERDVGQVAFFGAFAGVADVAVGDAGATGGFVACQIAAAASADEQAGEQVVGAGMRAGIFCVPVLGAGV